MSAEEYAELFDTALDALRDVITATEPGTGMALHNAFNEIKAVRPSALTSADEGSVIAEVLELQRQCLDRPRDAGSEAREADFVERKQAWRSLPAAVREHIVLEALGDRRMSLWDLACHLHDTRPDVYVAQSSLRKLLIRLVAAGELHAVNESPEPRPGRQTGGGRRRRVYFRNSELTGAIADLEKAFGQLEAARSHSTGGIQELRSFGGDPGVCNALTRGGHETVSEVEALTDTELLAVRGIGPGRVRQIRGAIERYRDHRRSEVA
jgi:hypothetical protein